MGCNLPVGMLVTKKNRKEIYKSLFREGVCYAEKDFNLTKHPRISVPNLQVIKLMQSFKSRGFVTERFTWRHFDWFLTFNGVSYLREYLTLPAEILPVTYKSQTRYMDKTIIVESPCQKKI